MENKVLKIDERYFVPEKSRLSCNMCDIYSCGVSCAGLMSEENRVGIDCSADNHIYKKVEKIDDINTFKEKLSLIEKTLEIIVEVIREEDGEFIVKMSYHNGFVSEQHHALNEHEVLKIEIKNVLDYLVERLNSSEHIVIDGENDNKYILLRDDVLTICNTLFGRDDGNDGDDILPPKPAC